MSHSFLKLACQNINEDEDAMANFALSNNLLILDISYLLLLLALECMMLSRLLSIDIFCSGDTMLAFCESSENRYCIIDLVSSMLL